MVDAGSTASHTLRLHSQVGEYDINPISLPQIEPLYVLIVALHQVT